MSDVSRLSLRFDADLGPETLFTLSLALTCDTFCVFNFLKQLSKTIRNNAAFSGAGSTARLYQMSNLLNMCDCLTLSLFVVFPPCQ